MKKILLSLFLVIFFSFSIFTPILAQEEFKDSISKGIVTSILETGEKEIAGYKLPYQLVEVKFLDGDFKNQTTNIEHGGQSHLTTDQLVKKNDLVVINTIDYGIESVHWIVDFYRINTLLIITGIFFLLVIFVAKWKGLGSIIGMMLSLVVIVKFTIPQILSGQNPLLISIITSMFILLSTIYLAHGYNRQTTVALFSTLACLIITSVISSLFVSISKLTGLGSEEALSLQIGASEIINLKGLLLGGIIIGATGVLDDITTSQSAAVHQLKFTNPKISTKELIKRSNAIGTEHITSLVNTLVMAYAGVALPLLIIISYNPQNQPLWSIFNAEIIAEEIVRTISGSIGLILAVPLTTFIAILSLKINDNLKKEDLHHHHH